MPIIGEVKIILINLGHEDFIIERGMRIAQMVIAPVVQAQPQIVDTLSDTQRAARVALAQPERASHD